MAEARPWCISAMVFFLPLLALSQAAVIITKDNSSMVFDSADASFTPKVPNTGMCGTLQLANPLNACVPLSNMVDILDANACSQFVLVSRGDCSFDTKVRHAQDAGFAAAIVVDNQENNKLVTMAGNKRGITIPAVFISKVAGEVLLQYANDTNAECWILPSYENIAWLVMVISFISLIAITAVFAICFLIRQRRSLQQLRRRPKENGISYQVVKSMPITIYQSKVNSSDQLDMCPICLEDYVDGAKLRTLPCNHSFHRSCIDAWLINWRGFCPICKQDVLKAPTERTPLLSSNGSSQQQLTIPSDELIQAEADLPPQQQQSQICHFSFGERLSQSDGAPIRTPTSRHLSHNGLSIGGSRQRQLDQDSMEAFRASPYFTPPSYLHNSAPDVFSLPRSASSDSQLNGGSLLEASLSESPPSAGDSQLR